jgi:hypothetical protein
VSKKEVFESLFFLLKLHPIAVMERDAEGNTPLMSFLNTEHSISGRYNFQSQVSELLALVQGLYYKRDETDYHFLGTTMLKMGTIGWYHGIYLSFDIYLDKFKGMGFETLPFTCPPECIHYVLFYISSSSLGLLSVWKWIIQYVSEVVND